MDAVGGVLDGVVEEVEDGGAEVFGDAGGVEADGAGDGLEDDGVGGEVVALEGDGDAVGDEGLEVDEGAVVLAAARWPSSPALRTCSTVARRRSESESMML